MTPLGIVTDSTWNRSSVQGPRAADSVTAMVQAPGGLAESSAGAVVRQHLYGLRNPCRPRLGLLRTLSSEHRAASGLSGGEAIEVEIIPDVAPREVEVPADLAIALADAPDAAAFLAGLSHTHKLAYVLWIE